MKKYVATVNDRKAALFQEYCRQRGVSPYSVLVAHINSLIGEGDGLNSPSSVPDDQIKGLLPEQERFLNDIIEGEEG